MQNVRVLFQKSWEEKKSRKKENPLPVPVCSSAPCPVGRLSSTWPASLWEGGMLLTSHKEREAGCRCHHDYQQIWDRSGGKEERQQEQCGVYPQCEGAANKCLKKAKPTSSILWGAWGEVDGDVVAQSCRVRHKRNQGSQPLLVYLEFLFWISVLFSVSSSLLRKSGYRNRGPSYFFWGNFVWPTEIFPRRLHLPSHPKDGAPWENWGKFAIWLILGTK